MTDRDTTTLPREVVEGALEALDNLISACELPGDHCEVAQALPHAKAALRRDAERLTDEQIDSATSKERDDLLDHIYEYGTAAEGILERIRKLARAAIDAAMQEDKT